MADLVIHEAANSFPMMDAKRFAELVVDIEKNGLNEPITLCDGKVLDGRNRAKACAQLGIDPFCKVTGMPAYRRYEGDPWSYVWTMNGQRRDLDQDTRAQIGIFIRAKSDSWLKAQEQIREEGNRKRSEAAKVQPRAANGTMERKPEAPQTPKARPVVVQSVQPPASTFCAPTRAAKAASLGVNAGAIARAEALERKRPDLAEKVRQGEIKPTEARRQVKRDEVAQNVTSLPTSKYTVIYSDPPWSYNDKQGGTISESYGAAEKHYPSMSLSELKAMGVPDIAEQNAVLFLWATSPLLPDALELAKAWGFTYKASFIWDKVKHNMGHYNSVRHEILLVCTRGSCTPQVVKLFDSVQSIERTDKHSEKPEEFRKIIDTLYPNGKRIELFSRSDKEGWDHYGAGCS
jgi:N6-adenosine-specific RNA methylase IME4